MSPQTASFNICFILTFAILCQGLQLFMDTTPDGVYCGHLYCWTDKSITSSNIRTIFGIAVYDVNKYSESVKVASLSVFGPDVCLRESEVTSINATGNVSKYHAELILAFSDTRDCFNGSFVCELEFANVNNDPDVIRKTASSGSSDTCYDIVKELVGNDQENFEAVRELVELRKQKLALEAEVSRLQKIVNMSRDMTEFQTKEAMCVIATTHNNSRERVLLWDKVPALCDTETEGGGWIVIQRRTTGDVDFYRDWKDYKNGFGTPETDFWIGNDVIHNLTSQGYTELRVDMEYNETQYFAHYSHFDVANETSFYRLSVSGYNGTTGDSLADHNGRNFSTFDNDNDDGSDNCASTYHGAWWYNGINDCYYSNLNGMWGAGNWSGLVWDGVVGPGSVSVSEMKVRHV